MVTGEKPIPLYIVADLMGHSSSAAIEIYIRAIADEKQKMVFKKLDERDLLKDLLRGLLALWLFCNPIMIRSVKRLINKTCR